MRKLHSIVMALAALVLLATAASAVDSTKQAEKAAPKELKNQTLCPVMGGKIDSSVYTDIQGQRVYHCCPMCSKKMKADPDKYFKKAAEEGILFENIQTVCPLSGETLDSNQVSTYYEGRQINFCCNKCRSTFAKDPAKYLSKMDEPADTTATAEEPKGGHEHQGHEHHDHDH